MPAKWNRRKDPCRVGVIGHDLTHLSMPQQVFICPVFAAGNRSRPNRIDSSLPFLPRLNPLSSTAQGSSLEALPPSTNSAETSPGCGGPHQVTKDKQARYTGGTPEVYRRYTGTTRYQYPTNALPSRLPLRLHSPITRQPCYPSPAHGRSRPQICLPWRPGTGNHSYAFESTVCHDS